MTSLPNNVRHGFQLTLFSTPPPKSSSGHSPFEKQQGQKIHNISEIRFWVFVYVVCHHAQSGLSKRQIRYQLSVTNIRLCCFTGYFFSLFKNSNTLSSRAWIISQLWLKHTESCFRVCGVPHRTGDGHRYSKPSIDLKCHCSQLEELHQPKHLNRGLF